MADSLTLIVLVATGGSPAAMDALEQAAHESLGAETHIEFRQMPHEASESEALVVERRDNADAVAELSWKDRKHRQALLRVHVAHPRRWLERTLTFDAADEEVERSRTLGYAMAAILPEPFPHYAPHHGETTAPPPPPPPPPAPKPPEPLPPPPPPSPPRSRVPVASLDLLATADFGIGPAGANALGAELVGQWLFMRFLSVRFGGGVHGGMITVTGDMGSHVLGSYSRLALYPLVGVAFHAVRPTVAQPLGITLHTDFLVAYETVMGPSNAVSTNNATWVPGVDVGADVTLMFVQGMEVVAGVGIQGLFAPIDLDVRINNGIVADPVTIPPTRVVSAVGLRVTF